MILERVNGAIEQTVIGNWSHLGFDSQADRYRMWQRNSRGPRDVPFGTPESTLTSSDNSPLSTSSIVRFRRKFDIHL